MKLRVPASLGIVALLGACGPTAEEQAAMDAAQRSADQKNCTGFGFAPGTESFAHCMLQVASQRDAQAAADRRAAADRAAADQRAKDAQQAAKDQADRDAWDRRTGQGAYSPSSSSSDSSFSANPADRIRDQIQEQIDKASGAASPIDSP